MKIALCFIITDKINNFDLWIDFFNSNYFYIYIHCSNPSILDKRLYKYLLPRDFLVSSKEISWGYLTPAYWSFIHFITIQKNISHLMFLSDSCIPLYSPKKTYLLLNTPLSQIQWLKLNDHDINKRYERNKVSLFNIGINKDNFKKHSGWYCLTKYDCIQLYKWKHKAYKIFNNIEAGDEFLLSCLVTSGIQLSPSKMITFTNWKEGEQNISILKKQKEKLWKKFDCSNDNIYKNKIKKKINKINIKMNLANKHPKSYYNLSDKLLKCIQDTGAIFARKFYL